MPIRRLAAAALAIVVAGCTGQATVASPSPSSTTTTTADVGTTQRGPDTPGSLVWRSCGGPVECATLAVPLDYGDPSGRQIDLALVRVPARDPSRRIGSLLVNPGGPGGSGVDFVAGGFSFGGDVADRFDLVGWDPRGVGGSAPLHCGDTVDAFLALDSSPDDSTEQRALDDAAARVADECATEDGDELAHIGTDDVVRDMESIRVALGEQQISYVGFSYGTLLGERYLDAYPDGARAVVLDGVVDPATDFAGFLRGQTVALEATMRDVFASFDGGAALYDEIAAAVERQPIGPLGPAELATAAIFVTYDPTAWSLLGRGLRDAAAGDGSTLSSLAEQYRSFGGFTAYAGIECIDSPHPSGADEYKAFADELAALSPRFGAAVANELLPCAFWPVAPVGHPDDVHGAGGPPVLVVGNTGDAATPYEQAVKVAGTLESGHLLTLEGDGHTGYGKSDCVDRAVEAYLVDLTLPPDGTRCR